MAREIGRIPAERSTHYEMLKKFETENEVEDGLDTITDYSQFGSYAELIKINKFKYKNPRGKIIVSLR